MLNNIHTLLSDQSIRTSPAKEQSILICDFNKLHGAALQLFLSENGFKNVFFQPDITEVKKYIYYKKPEVIISGNHLWEDTSGILFITEMRLPKTTRVIIFSDTYDQRMLSLKVRYNNLHFLKQTSQEKELIVCLSKL